MKIPESLKKRAAELEDYYSRHYETLAPLVSQCFLNTKITFTCSANEIL